MQYECEYLYYRLKFILFIQSTKYLIHLETNLMIIFNYFPLIDICHVFEYRSITLTKIL